MCCMFQYLAGLPSGDARKPGHEVIDLRAIFKVFE